MNVASDFYAQYPELRERVIFTGEIRDRNELMEMLRDAKIFTFPSRTETFGMALSEALMQGDFPVVSKIPTNKFLTCDYKFGLGSEVEDSDGLAENLLYACTHENEIESLALQLMDITRKRLDLRRCCDVIAGKLQGN